MKFISWNVNGLRACVQKGFTEYFQEADADFLPRRDITPIGIMR